MGWFRSRAGKDQVNSSASMTAAGARINLQDRDTITTIAASRQGWQHTAWNYRDLIGELGSALRFRSNALAKVSLEIAQVNPHGDVPIAADSPDCTLDPIVAKAAQDALDRLPWREGHSFAGKLDTCFSIAGEGWLYGKTDADSHEETWTIRSTDEVQPVAGSAMLGIVEVPGRPAKPIDPVNDALMRLWAPHPRFMALADSPMRAMLDPCQDIVLIGRELRAAAQSRIAANGVWIIPFSMSLPKREAAGQDDVQEDTFGADLAAAMIAPIANEGDPGAVAPIVIRADNEDIEAASKGRLTFQRETSPELIDKLNNALKRMGETLDIPPTVVTGLQDTNHWNAYVIDAQTWTNHLEPGMRMIVDSLTVAYLRTILVQPVTQGGYGLTKEQAKTVQIWYDAGKVTENPNRAADAQSAYGLGVIGPKTLRRDMGFEEADAPTDQELAVMIALKVAPDPATSGQLISKALGIPLVVPTPGGGTAQVSPTGDPQQVTRQQPAPPIGHQPQQRALPQPQASVPAGGPMPPAIQGAAHQQRVLDSEGITLIDGAPLIAIERHLRDRLLVACDAAVTEAIEKAGKRVASAAQHKVDKAVLTQYRGIELARHLGQAGVAELGVTEDVLLSAAFAYLAAKFEVWTLQAIKATVTYVAKAFALELTAVAQLTQTLAGRRKTAWNRLEHSMRQRALKALYGTHGTEIHLGESVDTIVAPGDIRAALAVIGGEPRGGLTDAGIPVDGSALGGLATGTTVLDAVARKAVGVGFVWQYGITPRHKHFQPHVLLDGHRFTSWTDKGLRTTDADAWVGEYFRPGDHAGCACDYVPVWALSDYVQRLQEELAEPETPSMLGDRILAEGDTQAGRTGTTAQRAVAERERILDAQRRWLSNAKAAQ